MTSVTYQGIQFTEKMLAEEPTATLLETYNNIAKANGETVVKKFADRKTAIKRVWAMLQKYGKDAKRPAKASGERRTRTKRFDYVAIGAPKARRESTPDNPVLRDMMLQGMLRPEGLSFNQGVDVVHEFDAIRKRLGKKISSARNKDGTPKTANTRAYEAMRLVHYYLNYSLKQDGDGDDAPVRIVGNRKA